MSTDIAYNIYLLCLSLLAAIYTGISFVVNIRIAHAAVCSRPMLLAYSSIGLVTYGFLGMYAWGYHNYLLAFVQALGLLKHIVTLIQIVVDK